MDNNLSAFVFAQLLAQSPVLLACLVGLILSIVFWRRCPTACLLTLIATALLAVHVVVIAFMGVLPMYAIDVWGWTAQKVGMVAGTIHIGGNILRAVALGLLLAAVFIKRAPVANPPPAVPA